MKNPESEALSHDIAKIDSALYAIWYCAYYEKDNKLKKILTNQVETLQKLREDICGERYMFPDEYLKY